MRLDPDQEHVKEKIKHSKRLADKNRYDHVKRTERIRRIFAQLRDHVRSVIRRR
jgi:hypothetical protein